MRTRAAAVKAMRSIVNLSGWRGRIMPRPPSESSSDPEIQRQGFAFANREFTCAAAQLLLELRRELASVLEGLDSRHEIAPRPDVAQLEAAVDVRPPGS